MNQRDAEVLLAFEERRKCADATLVELHVHYNNYPGPRQAGFYSRGEALKYSPHVGHVPKAGTIAVAHRAHLTNF